MKTLNYTKEITISDINININYNEKLPKFVLDVLTKAFNMQMGVYEYLKYKEMDSNSDMHKLIMACFRGYEELTRNYSKIHETLSDVITNGYIVRTQIVEGEIKSYNPEFDIRFAEINSQSFQLKDEEEISNKALEIVSRIYPQAINLTVDNITQTNTRTEEEIIELNFNNDSISVKGIPVTLNNLELSRLITENNLTSKFSKYKNKIPTGEWEFLTKTLLERMTDWHKIKNNNEKEVYYTKIKEGSFEWTTINSWEKLPYYKNTVFREGSFNQDTIQYQELLRLFIEEDITLNSFIYKAFFSNEFNVREKIIRDPAILKKIVQDRMLLSKILLHDSNFILDGVDLPKAHLVKILTDASNVQLPIMMSKIPLVIKDSLKDPKLLKKLNNVDPTLLSESQLKFINDEKAKQEAINDEYNSIVGKITTSGIREFIKKLTNAEKRKYQLGKPFTKWLNTVIGHNQGQTNITEAQLKKARTNLQKTLKVLKDKK